MIYQCDSDGVGLIKLETCPPEKPDTTKRGGELVCVAPDVQEETGLGAAFERFTHDVGEFLEDPFDNFLNKPMLAIDILATLLAVLVSFFIAQSRLVGPFVEVTADVVGVNETLLRFVIGVVFAVLAGYATYALISQLWVKLTILIGTVLFVVGYVYLQSLVPG